MQLLDVGPRQPDGLLAFLPRAYGQNRTITMASGGSRWTHTQRQQIAPARALAEFAAGLRYEDIPPPVLELAKLLILDALGLRACRDRL